MMTAAPTTVIRAPLVWRNHQPKEGDPVLLITLLADLALAVTCGGPLLPCSEMVYTPPLSCVTAPAAQTYEVEVKLGTRMCPILRFPVGQVGAVALPAPGPEGIYALRVHLDNPAKGSVRVELETQKVQVGCGGYKVPVVFRGCKTVDLDTVTGLVLSGDDPEPLCAQVTVRAVPPTTPPYPVPVAAPPCPLASSWCPAPAVCMPPPAPMVLSKAPLAVPEPMPLPTAIIPPAPFQVCTATTPCPPCRGAQVRLLHGCGKSRLQIMSDDGSTTGVRMVVERGQAGMLSMAAGKKFVHVMGKKWKAHADQVEVCPDGRVILTGHVKLVTDKIGVCATVKAEKLCVQVRHGCLDRIGEK
jgi:hypothetical protein